MNLNCLIFLPLINIKALGGPSAVPATSHTSSSLEVVVPYTFKQVAKSLQKAAMEAEMKNMKDRKVC